MGRRPHLDDQVDLSQGDSPEALLHKQAWMFPRYSGSEDSSKILSDPAQFAASLGLHGFRHRL